MIQFKSTLQKEKVIAKIDLQKYLAETIKYFCLPFLDIYEYNEEYFEKCKKNKASCYFLINFIRYLINNNTLMYSSNFGNKSRLFELIKLYNPVNPSDPFLSKEIITLFETDMKRYAPPRELSENMKQFLRNLDTEGQTDQSNRVKFLNLLAQSMINFVPPKSSSKTGAKLNIGNSKNRATIKLKDLLGSDKNVKEYKAAIAEENRSNAFIKAVALEEFEHYENLRWTEKAHIIVAGPSGIGKSYNSKKIINYLIEHNNILDSLKINQNKNAKIQDFIPIDGGIGRQVSQIRKIVLQCALALGYSGIEDLHQNSKFTIKTKIKKVAERSPVHIIEPLTFVREIFKFSKSDFQADLQNNLYHMIFVHIEGHREQIRINKSKRAWYNDPIKGTVSKPPQYVNINNPDVGCESKKEENYYLIGKRASEHYRDVYKKNYQKIHVHPTKESSRDSIIIYYYNIQDPFEANTMLNKYTIIKPDDNAKIPCVPKIFINGVWINKERLTTDIRAERKSIYQFIP